MNKGSFFRFGWHRFAVLLCLTLLAACNAGEDGMNQNPENPDSVQRRLRNLEDREEIGRLLVLYGRYLDRRDFASFSMLFSEEDGEWIGGMGRAKGRDRIRGLMESTIGKLPEDRAAAGFHLFTNESIEIDQDQASAETKWVFVMPDAGGRPQPVYLGHYEDTFIREQEGWKFLKRTAYTDIPEDAP